MIRLKKTRLIRPEFLELGFEELCLVTGDRLLVEYKNLRDVIIMDLALLTKRRAQRQ